MKQKTKQGSSFLISDKFQQWDGLPDGVNQNDPNVIFSVTGNLTIDVLYSPDPTGLIILAGLVITVTAIFSISKKPREMVVLMINRIKFIMPTFDFKIPKLSTKKSSSEKSKTVESLDDESVTAENIDNGDDNDKGSYFPKDT